jgi:hypothetical protein
VLDAFGLVSAAVERRKASAPRADKVRRLRTLVCGALPCPEYGTAIWKVRPSALRFLFLFAWSWRYLVGEMPRTLKTRRESGFALRSPPHHAQERAGGGKKRRRIARTASLVIASQRVRPEVAGR